MRILDRLRDTYPWECLDKGDLKLLLSDMTPAAQYSALARALKSKELTQLKRGVYLITHHRRQSPVSTFTVAAKLYSPSYISFQSALAYHALIPEAVYSTTSACIQMKKKRYSTPLGDFTYQHVPEASFRLDVDSVKSGSGSFLMGGPIKALFDTVYAERREFKSISDLEDDLRIDLDELEKAVNLHSFSELEELSGSYRKKRCEQFVQILLKEFK